MDNPRGYLEICFQVACECWVEEGKPLVADWFAQFLTIEENYTFVFMRCLHVIVEKKGQEWFDRQGLEYIIYRFKQALSYWRL